MSSSYYRASRRASNPYPTPTPSPNPYPPPAPSPSPSPTPKPDPNPNPYPSPGKPTGIFALLEEQGRLGERGTDKTFTLTLFNYHFGKNAHLQPYP